MGVRKLAVYNAALGHLGERKLASLSENREPRRVLDDFWSVSVAACLELGQWHFAKRQVSIDASTSVVVDFGYAKAFPKPTDWTRTLQVSGDEFFKVPLTNYKDESGYWYAEVDPLYVEYVSDDTQYGLDESKWSQLFEDLVALELAYRASKRISGADTDKDRLDKERKRARTEARNLSNSAQPPKEQPAGTWTTSRSGGTSNLSRWDRQSF